MKLATTLTLLLAACGADGNGPAEPVLAQGTFDLTAVSDRAWFEERDLAFVETLGPYALYEVTGSAPALLGPSVEFWGTAEGPGYAMLCGAHGYFANGQPVDGVQARLLGGADGDTEIVAFHQVAIQVDGCTGAREDIAERMPDDPEVDEPTTGEDPDAALGDGNDGHVERLNVSFDPAPAVGAYVLLQRVSLAGQRPPAHARSHSIPDVCCEGKVCILR